MDVYSEIYDGWLRTARDRGQPSFYLINKYTKNIRLQYTTPVAVALKTLDPRLEFIIGLPKNDKL